MTRRPNRTRSSRWNASARRYLGSLGVAAGETPELAAQMRGSTAGLPSSRSWDDQRDYFRMHHGETYGGRGVL